MSLKALLPIGGLLGCAALAVTACVPAAAPEFPQTPVSSLLVAEQIAALGTAASSVAVAADGRVFFAEKNTGQIRVIAGGLLQESAFVTVPVNFAGERGLLDIALHPDFASNNRIYALYVRSDTGLPTNVANSVVDTRVVYFTANGTVAGGGEVFVASLPASANLTQVGGRIAFDANRKLFVAIGDFGDPASAQAASPLVGKVLRYNDDGSIPSDNPDPGSPAFALGLRDPRGLSVDPQTGDPFAADRNNAGFQEVNRIRLNRNYGWPFVIGFAKAANELAFAAGTANYTDPLSETDTTITDLAGGEFNRGSRYGPRGQNQFFFGDGAGRRVFLAELNPDRSSSTVSPFAGPFPSAVTDITFSPSGTMFVACEGGIYRVVERQQ